MRGPAPRTSSDARRAVRPAARTLSVQRPPPGKTSRARKSPGRARRVVKVRRPSGPVATMEARPLNGRRPTRIEIAAAHGRPAVTLPAFVFSVVAIRSPGAAETADPTASAMTKAAAIRSIDIVTPAAQLWVPNRHEVGTKTVRSAA